MQVGSAAVRAAGANARSQGIVIVGYNTDNDFRADLGLGYVGQDQFNAGYLDACRDAGLIAYRGQERSRLYAAAGRNRETLLKRGARLIDAYLDLSGPHGAAPLARDGIVDVPSSRTLI